MHCGHAAPHIGLGLWAVCVNLPSLQNSAAGHYGGNSTSEQTGCPPSVSGRRPKGVSYRKVTITKLHTKATRWENSRQPTRGVQHDPQWLVSVALMCSNTKCLATKGLFMLRHGALLGRRYVLGRIVTIDVAPEKGWKVKEWADAGHCSSAVVYPGDSPVIL